MILSYGFGGWEVHFPGAHVCAVPGLKAGQSWRHVFARHRLQACLTPSYALIGAQSSLSSPKAFTSG